ncbi:MAG: FAD-dependent oxidoreductase [Paracoccaceae bacterium]
MDWNSTTRHWANLSPFENTRNVPYWWDDAGMAEPAADAIPAALPDKIEVLIIGAGYSGLSAALTLARAGREVLVIDAEKIGHSCSSRNGGQIGPSLHKLGLTGLTAAFGQQKAHAVLRESMGSLTFLQQFIRAEKIECNLQSKIGRFKGAVHAGDYEQIARTNEALAKSIGLNFEMIPKASQRRQIGSDYYHGGVVFQDNGLLHPAKFVQGMASKVLAAGARIIAPARATQIRQDGNEILVRIGNKRITAGQVLVATNGYSGADLKYYHRRIIPLRSAIIATENLSPELMQSVFPAGRPVVDSSRLVLYYRPSPDGKRVVFGGRAFDLADRPERYSRDLRRLMVRIFPQLSQSAISHAWSGTLGYTFDHAPHLGQREGVHYVMGYCGSGVGRATYFGHQIALQMLGEAAGKTELDGLTFPTRPLYSGKPWFLPSILRWHSLLDRIGL